MKKPNLVPCDSREHEDARHQAFSIAFMQTYPETLKKESEQEFLNVFRSHLSSKFPESISEDVAWAQTLLSYMRDYGFSDDELDVIADIASLEVSALEQELIPGQPNICKALSHCPECEHLLQCAEDDSAWTGDTLEEVRVLAFVSSLVKIGGCSKEDEELFLRTFWTHMIAELDECTSADLEWAKNAIKNRRRT